MAKITFPKSITEIAQTLGVTASSNSGKLQWLCGNTHNKINPWARYKPTSGGGKLNRATRDDNTDEYRFVTYGLAYYDENGTFTVNEGFLGDKLTTSNFSLYNLFNLKQQNLQYCRMRDFNGYDHDATFDLGENGYQCFSDETYGGQTGFFYNKESTMIQWNSSKTSGLNTTPLCYEDSGGTNYCSLDVKDLMAAATDSRLSTFQVGDFKFGVAFKINNEFYLFHTGKPINTILNNSSVVTYYITISNNVLTLSTSEYITPMLGSFKCGGSFFRLALNLGKFNEFYGQDVFRDGTSCSARAVLVKGGSTNVEFIKNTGAYDMYAFSPAKLSDDSIFGLRSNFTIKELKSYVNVTTNTNRTNNSPRNAGAFLGEYVSQASHLCDYNYEERNGKWNWYTTHDPYRYRSQCYLEFDSSHFYEISSDGTITTGSSTSGLKYVRYKLCLSGFVCSEFRTKTDSSTNFINSGDVLRKYANLYLRIEKQKFKNALVFIAVGNEKAVQLSGNDLNIGAPDVSEFAWTSTAASGDVANCTQYYEDETGNFSKCYSGLIQIDRLNYIKDGNGDVIKTYQGGAYTRVNDTYIYVQTNPYTSPEDPKEFNMSIDYTFSPVDIFEGGTLSHTTETIKVNQVVSNETFDTIEVTGSPTWPTS
jgi:hypothetical protein